MLFHRPSELQAFLAANSMLGQSARYREASLAECYYNSQQYDHLEEWEAPVELRRKKPRIVLPLFREAVDGIERFVWGGHRFPSVSVAATRAKDEPEQAGEIGPRLDVEQAEALTKFLRALVKATRLQRAAREFSRAAMIGRSCAVVLTTQGGHLVAHVEPGKHCTPTFDPMRPGELAELDICYVHQRDEDDGAGGSRERLYWYRRTITTAEDICYVEVPFRPGVPPKWVRDEQRTISHALGFCPARWVRPLAESSDPIDGRPIIDPALYPLLDEVNYTESLKNRTVQYNCDPWTTRTGVQDAEQDVRKSPGRIMDLPSESELKIVESSGAGAQRAAEHLGDLQRSFRDAVSFVKANPDIAVGRISGVVLEFLYAPMMALAADLREDFGEDGFAGVLNLALRLVTIVTLRGEDVWIQGVGAAAKLLNAAQLSGVWLDVPITIDWPKFFSPSVEEQKVMVEAANSARSGGLIAAKTATRAVAPIFGIEDVDAEHEQIEQEAADGADYGDLLGRRPGRATPPLPEPDDLPTTNKDSAAAGGK